MGEILALYEQDGYPDKTLATRPKSTEDDEKRHVATLRKFWGNILVQEVGDPTCDNYFRWRKRNITQVSGERTTDRELNTLHNAFRYAKRKGLIRVNPISDRPKYQKTSQVRHCREFMPDRWRWRPEGARREIGSQVRQERCHCRWRILVVLTVLGAKPPAERVRDALRVPRHLKKHPFPARHYLVPGVKRE